jgi:ubiquinone/menaquinone biosynthesis C-methylase UbiE
MSPHYVRYAAEQLRDAPGISLISDNAESMPFADEIFDAVTCIFLFHELPKDVRRTVLGEIFRVLRPGGTFVICDSAQLGEADDLEPFLEEFPQIYHEPYFKSYLRDDLAQVAAESGFEVTATAPAFLSRIVVCRRPGPVVAESRS